MYTGMYDAQDFPMRDQGEDGENFKEQDINNRRNVCLHRCFKIFLILHSQPARLLDFMYAWDGFLPQHHPTREIGLCIIRDLLLIERLEFPVTEHIYTAPNDSLLAHSTADLFAIQNLPLEAIRADSRFPGSEPLLDCRSLMAALQSHAPVAFDVMKVVADGIYSAPPAFVPNYVHTMDRTLFAGAGAICSPIVSTSRDALILHGIAGRSLVLHCPARPDNVAMLLEGPLQEQFQWAARQPGAVLQVMHAGESIFIPSRSWRAIMAINDSTSEYSAMIFSYAWMY